LPFTPEVLRIAPARDEVGDVLGGARTSVLARGAGRTYGDTNVNSGGTLVSSERLDRILEFDPTSGCVLAEAGVTLAALLARAWPSGWTVAACPGTARVTLGGMIAHDVHGKNHLHVGSFGRHVTALRLVRSDGVHTCSPAAEPELFRATIGGLGLTGFVEQVAFGLVPFPGREVRTERVRCTSLDSALDLLRDRAAYDHGLIWIDGYSLCTGAPRCVVLRAQHTGAATTRPTSTLSRTLERVVHGAGRLAPRGLLNPRVMRVVNRLYYSGPFPFGGARSVRTEDVGRFLFPQDSAHASNRVYGRSGVLGHHSLVRTDEGLHTLLARLAVPGDEPPLIVLKVFGDHTPTGPLSFSGPGISVATGYPNRGARVHEVLCDLDRIVLDDGGKLYPAKDARMGREAFARSYPEVPSFAKSTDPAFDSNFWRRVCPSTR